MTFVIELKIRTEQTDKRVMGPVMRGPPNKKDCIRIADIANLFDALVSYCMSNRAYYIRYIITIIIINV